MARDTKKPRSSNKNGGSLLTGLLVGLIVGVVAAVGVALYVNRSANPFGNKTASAPTSAPQPTAAPGLVPEILLPTGSEADAAAQASAAAQKASGIDRFDFYTMLPATSERTEIDVKPVEIKPPVASTPAKSDAISQSWLQVGSFQNEHDADNLKARLALIGIQARIQTQDIPDKGLWHRVRIGPFSHAADIDKARAQLRGNGIDSNVVKSN